jgi:hypothetical protein
VSLVYEENVGRTDIIDDSTSPRWMPWSKRAFIFRMIHCSSQLFVGVFDFDENLNPTDDHDLVGRTSVELANLRRDTTYTLRFNLFKTAHMAKRDLRGSITLRIRIEVENDRLLLASVLHPPPPMYLNLRKRKDYRVVRQTCFGLYNMDRYGMDIINS